MRAGGKPSFSVNQRSFFSFRGDETTMIVIVKVNAEEDLLKY